MKLTPALLLVLPILLTASSALAAEAPRKRVAMSEKKLLEILATGSVTELDQVPPLLPASFRSNFMIKHGLVSDEKGEEIHGPRGHLTEPDVPGFGQHAEPLSPRTFVFDPYTGFAISYNGGKTADGKPQEGGQSLDTISFDFSQKTFRLVKIDFPLASPGSAQPNSQNCILCHGPSFRPIFSMYPDWPRFYGSDNDELRLGQKPKNPNEQPDFSHADEMTKRRRDMQLREYAWFHKLRDEVAPGHPRFASLWADDAYKVHGFSVKQKDYPEYPYRSDVEQPGKDLDASDESRAFTRRAGLRFNLLYSRLHVQEVVQKIVSHPRFKDYGNFFVYNLMRCAQFPGSNSVMKTWKDSLLRTLTEVEKNQEITYYTWNKEEEDEAKRLVAVGSFKLPDGKLSLRAGGGLLDYGQNLALFGLKINDVDMRFTYYHDAYKPENAFRNLCDNLPEGKDCADQVMQVGYLQDNYFNAYNDGSTTMDEHVTSNLLQALAKKDAELAAFLKKRGPYAIRGLLNKYSGETFEKRLKLDREFFAQMDSYSKWFSLPYPYKEGDKDKPKNFFNLHHRAAFSVNYRDSFTGVCQILTKRLSKAP